MKVDFKDVQEDYKRLNAEIDELKQRNAALESQQSWSDEDISDLHTANNELMQRNADLSDTVAELNG